VKDGKTIFKEWLIDSDIASEAYDMCPKDTGIIIGGLFHMHHNVNYVQTSKTDFKIGISGLTEVDVPFYEKKPFKIPIWAYIVGGVTLVIQEESQFGRRRRW
jgi:hypothetical protein